MIQINAKFRIHITMSFLLSFCYTYKVSINYSVVKLSPATKKILYLSQSKQECRL